MKIKALIVSIALLLTAGCGGGGSDDAVGFLADVQTQANPTNPTTPVTPTVPTVPSPTGVVFFQDNAPAGGMGTASSPFNSLAQAIAAANAGEAVFLFAGSGIPVSFTGAIPDGVQLVGEGVGFTQGAFAVPAGTFPRIQGQVTLGNGSTVQGIQFENPTGDALVSNGSISGFVVNNRFANISGDALILEGATGSFRVDNNQFNDNLALNPAEGVLVNLRQSQNLNLSFQNNLFATPDRTASFDNGLHVIANDNAQLTLEARGNSFDNQGSGLNFQFSGSASLVGLVTQNTFAGSGLEGISMLAGLTANDATSSDFTVSSNTFNNNLGPGVLLRARGNGAVSHDWSVDQNIITAGGSFGILCVRGEDAEVQATISNNTVSNATQSGIQYTSGTASGGFTVPLAGVDRITMSGNQTTGSGVSAVDLNLISVTQAVLMTNNTTGAPIIIMQRGTNACLAAGQNTIGGAFSATVETGFSLTFDDRGQSSPNVTFPGGGAVVNGACAL